MCNVATILQEWDLILSKCESILMRNDKLRKWWLIGILTIYRGDDQTIQEYDLQMKKIIIITILQVEIPLDGKKNPNGIKKYIYKC